MGRRGGQGPPSKTIFFLREGPKEGAAARGKEGGRCLYFLFVFRLFPFCLFGCLLRHTGARGSPAMSAEPRFGGGPHDGDRF